MNRLKSGLIALGILAVVFSFTGQASAGGGNIPGLASCETAQVNGPSLSGEASVVLDQNDNGDVTVHLKFNGQDFYFRAYITGINTGSSTKEMACSILNKSYFDGTQNTTLNATIINALGFTKPKVIMIAKNSIDAPAGSFGNIPAEPRGNGVRSALVSITLYAQQQ